MFVTSPSLHDWLTRKQKETRRGRAELLLADCGGVERSPGESATAVAVAMDANSLVDAQEELDAAATEDDGRGRTVSCGTGDGRLVVLALVALGGYEGQAG